MAYGMTKIFSKKLSATDAKYKLAVPTRSMGFLPSFNGRRTIDIVLICGTKTWPIAYIISDDDFNLRPTFSKGWSKFAADNGLKLDDKISCYQVSPLLYRVEVEKPVVDAGGTGSNRRRPDLPSPDLSLNHEEGETSFGKRPQELPRDVAGASRLMELARCATDTPRAKIMPQSSKPGQVLRQNLQDLTNSGPKPVWLFGNDISPPVAMEAPVKGVGKGKDKKETKLSGLAAEGGAIEAHGCRDNLLPARKKMRSCSAFR